MADLCPAGPLGYAERRNQTPIAGSASPHDREGLLFKVHPAVFMIALLAGPAPAAASPSGEAAERLFEEAQNATRVGDFPAALRLLQRTYSIDPQPKYVANQGIVYLKMGQFAEAAERFDWFLERTDDPDDRALAETFLRRLRPQVIIRSQPPGAEVRVNRERRGATPLITSVLVGDHLLEVSQDGYRSVDRALKVLLDEPQTVEVTLEPVQSPVLIGTTGTEAPPAEGAWTMDDWAWSVLGVGLLSAAASGTLASLAFARTDARDAADSRDAWREAQGDAEALATGYYVTGGLAAVGLVAGAALLVVAHAEGPGVAVGPGWTSISIRF